MFGDLHDGFYGSVNTEPAEQEAHHHDRVLLLPLDTLQVLVLVEGFKVGKMDIMELVRVCIARGLGSLCYNCSYSSVVVMGG